MSLVSVPVCASCGKPSGRSISCTKCFLISCTACFNDFVDAAVTAGVDIGLLRDQICRRCSNGDGKVSVTGTNAGKNMDPTDGASGKTRQNLCRLHRKACTLFCLICSVEVCGACLESGEHHELHQVSNLAVVYREKVSQLQSKLMQAEKVNDDLQAQALIYGRNLELLEKERGVAEKKVEAMANSSKEEISLSTDGKTKFLNEKLEIPGKHKAVAVDLQNKVEYLSMNDFLQQHPDMDKKCDQLIAEPNPIDLQNVDCIYSDLVQPYCFETVVFPGFLNAEAEKVHVAHMKTEYGVDWKFTVRKAEMLQIEPSCKLANAYRHELVVTITHVDYLKEVRQTFELQHSDEVFEVLKTSDIVEQKFCGDNGDLSLKIGIRPSNAGIEIRLLRNLISSSAKRYDYNYLIMHFNPVLSDIQENVSRYSLEIKDEKDRSWSMYVKLNATNLEAYVQLVKGPPCSSNFFIELKHINPDETRIKNNTKLRFFNTSGIWGFPSFISWDKLKNDAGFHPNGVLTFSFGVRPLPYEATTPIVGTANA